MHVCISRHIFFSEINMHYSTYNAIIMSTEYKTAFSQQMNDCYIIIIIIQNCKKIKGAMLSLNI